MRIEPESNSGSDEKFKVDPHFLFAYQKALRELQPAAKEAVQYAQTWTELDPSGGSLMERIVDVLYNVREESVDFLTDVHDLTRSAAAEMGAAATLYKNLDDDARKAIDKTYWTA